MRVEIDPVGNETRAEALLVLLPPAQATIDELRRQGFVDAVRRRNIDADIALAEVTCGHVLAQQVAAEMRRHVLVPARNAGYRSIWLAGISLGAFSALYCAAGCAGELAGIHLMAPYPGTGDVVAEIAAAGGPAAWAATAQSESGDERAWWRWLCREAESGWRGTAVFMSTGSEDRFLAGQRLMADLLPGERVRYLSGAHQWSTWLALWTDWLDRGPLAGQPMPATVTS
jgi:pimeloyl-ACP methyl ester carboxylesterase